MTDGIFEANLNRQSGVISALQAELSKISGRIAAGNSLPIWRGKVTFSQVAIFNAKLDLPKKSHTHMDYDSPLRTVRKY